MYYLFAMQWAEPYPGIGGGRGAVNDFDLLISYVSNPSSVLSTTNGTTNSLGDTPFELAGIRTNAPVTIRISITKVNTVVITPYSSLWPNDSIQATGEGDITAADPLLKVFKIVLYLVILILIVTSRSSLYLYFLRSRNCMTNTGPMSAR